MKQALEHNHSQLYRRFVACCLALPLFVATPSTGHAQDALPSWTNTSGTVIKAEFIRLEKETLVIRKDGKVFNVPFSKLSEASQKQAKRLSQSKQQVMPSADLSQEPNKTFQEIEKLKQKLDPKKFDFGIHNKLRSLYWKAGDKEKSYEQIEIILQNTPLENYMKSIIGGWKSGEQAKEAYLRTAEQSNKFPNLMASCFVWAAELESDSSKAKLYIAKAKAVIGSNVRLAKIIENKEMLQKIYKQVWPKNIQAPKGLKDSPGPWNDPVDTTIWPNRISRANSDPWLAENHDRIKLMKPRVLLINFSNEHDKADLSRLTDKLIKALAESSRYHGYKNEDAPAFLRYEVFKFVDLRDPNSTTGNSRKVPLKNPEATSGYNFAYAELFSDRFAKFYGIPDPRNEKRMMNLGDLLDSGYIHEVWFFSSGNTKAKSMGAYEVVEQKPKYDDRFRRIGNEWVQAGNGGDNEQPWVGRSCRIGNINASRGVGCFLESLAHGVEGTSTSNAIPYFRKYFVEYADFNLKERYGLPFDRLYSVQYNKETISYPSSNSAIISHGGKEHRIEDYIPVGGSVHFPPNARRHYDMNNDQPVLYTMEDWRTAGKGKDRQKVYTSKVIDKYRALAPDCMGAWLVYWRQNMPGLDNQQKDDNGRPMKNWWPFLFY